MNIEFGSFYDENTHRCNSTRQGDWIIFECPKCPNYERRLNWKTGKMKLKEGIDSYIMHRGSFVPEILKDNPNHSTLN